MRRCDPCRLSLVSLAVTLAAFPAFADWKLSEYRTLAADSAAVNRIYGIQSFSNRGTNTALSVERDSTGTFLRFNASKIASDGTEGYTANVGFLHPITPDWASYDLTRFTGIQFEYRNSAPITDQLTVAIGSDAYTPLMSASQTTYQCSITGKAALAAHGSWVTATLDILDFAPPQWWTPTADFPTLSHVLERVKNLEFSPKTLYSGDGSQNGKPCTKCVGPTMPKQILDIRNVMLMGLNEQPWPPFDTLIDTTIVVPPPPPPPPPPPTNGYLLSSYAKPALDSASTAAAYGIVSAANPASQAMALVPGGFVRLEAPVIASEPASAPNGNGYTAYVGLIHPLRADWREANLRKLTAVRFQFRNFSKITDALNVSFASSAYTAEEEKAGVLYEYPVTGSIRLAADTNWKSVDLDILDFAPPRWWTPPPGYPTLDSVLSRVRSISFVPQTLYSGDGLSNGKLCTRCVGPTMTKQRLDIRDVRLMGIDSLELVPLVEPPPPPPTSDSCTGSKVVLLDDFLDGNVFNQLGGSWFAYSDAVGMTAEQVGSSSAYFSVFPGSAKLDATLNKKVGEVWHASAGWAGVTASLFEGIDLEGLTGIEFQLNSMGLSPTVGLSLKVRETSVEEGSTLSAPIQAGSTVCVTPESLRPPKNSWRSTGLDLSRIEGFSWEARIQDETRPFLDTARAVFSLKNVRLYGADPERVSRSLARKAKSNFAVSYQQGTLRLVGIEGLGQVEIRDLQGRTVAGFAAASRVPLRLGNGTYILSAKRNGVPLTKSFAVMGR
ncbi:MAG: hypothetical protein IPK50_07370 [Fibrobacterota bacterium]|nr:hypothetical protein [Fibrobacterota bacterium]QQS06713.1 MAG: hypothetical protein IPK50_07370 [Fibrobacterota bacterium]